MQWRRILNSKKMIESQLWAFKINQHFGKAMSHVKWRTSDNFMHWIISIFTEVTNLRQLGKVCLCTFKWWRIFLPYIICNCISFVNWNNHFGGYFCQMFFLQNTITIFFSALTMKKNHSICWSFIETVTSLSFQSESGLAKVPLLLVLAGPSQSWHLHGVLHRVTKIMLVNFSLLTSP